MATYTIFGGVNGAGKTSIYKSIYYKRNKNEKRINTDEMVARIGSWKDNNIQIKCAREAVKLINNYIKNDISFNQETTLSGKSIVRNIKKAKEKGFYVVMNYIGVDNPDIAKERVKIRVLRGGHGIPEEAIERRYYESLDNLKELLTTCDEINIYDNTKNIEQIAYLVNGNVKWKSENIPKWSNCIFEYI
ncbi:zeta toxin family protein [Clostridium cochlearium]|jgi:predicted ABC-type ATPase|uniref:UDP-N-acetylglucosamine kinase n=1 Tax=Clostridium cochlearium TaxID=1494 RepID=A0ABY0QKI4_CLOCO|nr:zeta toxin family protein [Clostridium cochlearium]MBE6065296.1 ATPase [Clostridium cochlearium]MDU1442831.1 zeta toxin family protein [Clostridium cochlearium]NMA58533.1 ATPase [Clostridium cochlearium]SDL06708.1 Predicted ABC-type ATPase [Clostridium cochlearium]SNV80461.1 putative ATPase [Clostridium cochlearium]